MCTFLSGTLSAAASKSGSGTNPGAVEEPISTTLRSFGVRRRPRARGSVCDSRSGRAPDKRSTKLTCSAIASLVTSVAISPFSIT